MKSIHTNLSVPAVIKSVFGFSGSGQQYVFSDKGLDETQLGWIAKQLDSHKGFVEPWLDRRLDGSVLWNSDGSSKCSFISDVKGHYCNHYWSYGSENPKGFETFMLNVFPMGKSY